MIEELSTDQVEILYVDDSGNHTVQKLDDFLVDGFLIDDHTGAPIRMHFVIFNEENGTQFVHPDDAFLTQESDGNCSQQTLFEVEKDGKLQLSTVDCVVYVS